MPFAQMDMTTFLKTMAEAEGPPPLDSEDTPEADEPPPPYLDVEDSSEAVLRPYTGDEPPPVLAAEGSFQVPDNPPDLEPREGTSSQLYPPVLPKVEPPKEAKSPGSVKLRSTLSPLLEAEESAVIRPSIPEEPEEDLTQYLELRPEKDIYIVVLGRDGVGRTSVMNNLFADPNFIEHRSPLNSPFQSGQPKPTVRLTRRPLSIHGGPRDDGEDPYTNKNLVVITIDLLADVPQAKSFFQTEPVFVSPNVVVPHVVILVFDASDPSTYADLENYTEALRELEIVDKNLLVVVTHAEVLGTTEDEFMKNSSILKYKLITKLAAYLSTFTLVNYSMQIVLVENFPVNLEKCGDFHLFPNGEMTPLNLLQGIKHVLKETAQPQASVFLQWLFRLSCPDRRYLSITEVVSPRGVKKGIFSTIATTLKKKVETPPKISRKKIEPVLLLKPDMKATFSQVCYGYNQVTDATCKLVGDVFSDTLEFRKRMVIFTSPVLVNDRPDVKFHSDISPIYSREMAGEQEPSTSRAAAAEGPSSAFTVRSVSPSRSSKSAARSTSPSRSSVRSVSPSKSYKSATEAVSPSKAPAEALGSPTRTAGGAANAVSPSKLASFLAKFSPTKSTGSGGDSPSNWTLWKSKTPPAPAPRPETPPPPKEYVDAVVKLVLIEGRFTIDDPDLEITQPKFMKVYSVFLKSDLPRDFDPGDPKCNLFYEFLIRYGTHVILSVPLGGIVTLNMKISKEHLVSVGKERFEGDVKAILYESFNGTLSAPNGLRDFFDAIGVVDGKVEFYGGDSNIISELPMTFDQVTPQSLLAWKISTEMYPSPIIMDYHLDLHNHYNLFVDPLRQISLETATDAYLKGYLTSTIGLQNTRNEAVAAYLPPVPECPAMLNLQELAPDIPELQLELLERSPPLRIPSGPLVRGPPGRALPIIRGVCNPLRCCNIS